MFPNPGFPAAVSGLKRSMLLYAPCLVFSSFGICKPLCLQTLGLASLVLEAALYVLKHCIRIIQHLPCHLVLYIHELLFVICFSKQLLVYLFVPCCILLLLQCSGLAATSLCHFSSLVILSLLVAAVLPAFVHICSNAYLSFCLSQV